MRNGLLVRLDKLSELPDEQKWLDLHYGMRNIDRDHPERTVSECSAALSAFSDEIAMLETEQAQRRTAPPPDANDDEEEETQEEKYLRESMSNDDLTGDEEQELS